MRKLPVYLLIDVSESMSGAPFAAVQNALRDMMSFMERDPDLLETCFISVITYSDQAEQIVPLTDILEFQLPELNTHGGRSGLGAALRFVTECANREVLPATQERRGDWKPFLFIFSNGRADDGLEEGIRALRARKWEHIVACIPDKEAKNGNFKKITGSFLDLESINEYSFLPYFFPPDDIIECESLSGTSMPPCPSLDELPSLQPEKQTT